MSWFITEGQNPQITIWSTTEYIRNLASMPFRRADSESEHMLFAKADSILTKNGFRKQELPDGLSSEIMSLEEKQLINHSFAMITKRRALYLNEPCNLSISLGDTNFLVIRSILGGLSIEESRKIAAEAEEMLDDCFDFAYSQKFGYLSPNISSCGSGCIFSAALFLPAMTESDEINALTEECLSRGISLSPMFLHNDCSKIYKLSYKPSHTKNETQEAEFFKSALQKIATYESKMINIIFSEKRKLIEDGAWRAFGNLSFARLLSESELLIAVSDIRLALMLCENGLPPIGIPTLNKLLSQCLNASVSASTDPPCDSLENCNFARAEIARKIISDSNSQ